MKFLIRFVTRNAAGGTDHRDRIIEAPIITIGRATDQMLHLQDKRARLQHAQLEDRNGKVHITTSALAGVDVNGRSQRDARLVSGDVVEVGANILRVIDAPPGADFALTFELNPEFAREELATEWNAVGTGTIGKRKLSWILVAVVLLLTLVGPGVSVLSPDISSMARHSDFLPDDSWWLAGPLHSAHSSISGDCRSCHVNAFERVPDAACTECHKVSRHVSGDVNTVLGERRCASCHLEHNEPPQLVKQHQGLCADCHQNLPGNVALENAGDFLRDHPAFKVSLLRPRPGPEGTSEWGVEHLLLSEARTADRSNLKFDHAAHLDRAGIITPDGRRVLECAECHQPQPGGARMRPISMNDHCAGCHSLNFDPDDPRRTVPHGDPEGVMQTLVEYYSARLLGDEPEAGEQRVRRPGRALTRADRDRAAAEARVKAMTVATDLFERRVCANCHEVTRTANRVLPWHVEPVKLTERFFPHANFTHAAHDTASNECDSCHGASTSESSSDVLIPAIETCRDCHGSAVASRNSAAQTPSTCIMCHSFHFEAKGIYP
ncbi:MAG: FHA domain-containing protein [Gammaproteobacteria bacterium]|nr:FHA domain-containing protein [Gammaproteobacteria bacterium]